MDNSKQIKQFIFNAFLLEDTLEQLEKDGISVKHGSSFQTISRIEETNFSPRIRFNANTMSSIYTAFFCIENAVRELIVDRLAERKGIDWWETCTPEKIKKEAQKIKEREEVNRYHSSRSESWIGYTMFGNLAQIIINNWEDFSDLFPNEAWITSRFNDLEMSRNIIMHTGLLPEIEIDRIESIIRDWIRQVG